MNKKEVILLTESRYLLPVAGDAYISNILLEDTILADALQQRGITSRRVAWDDPGFDWTAAAIVLFRTPWDYFHRYAEFSTWLDTVGQHTRLVNEPRLIRWNIHKGYLQELSEKGIRIPPTVFVKRGDERTLADHFAATGWKEGIIKPAIGGTARHTYRFNKENLPATALIFEELIREEDMLVQEFQSSITGRGEVAFMVMNGRYTHAVLKRAKPGDFRVQDDFGGTLHDYPPAPEEIALAERVVAACPDKPLYARVDVMWNNEGQPCVSELEIIEPELWFRREPMAAGVLAEGIRQLLHGV